MAMAHSPRIKVSECPPVSSTTALYIERRNGRFKSGKQTFIRFRKASASSPNPPSKAAHVLLTSVHNVHASRKGMFFDTHSAKAGRFALLCCS